MSWEDSEPSLSDALHTALRHIRNAVRRSKLVLLPGLLIGPLVFVTLWVMKPTTYTSTVSFRALQGWERGSEKGLYEFFVGTVMTADILEPVIEANGLYRSAKKRADYLAVEEFREDLDVEVERWELPDSTTLARRNAVAIMVRISFTHSKREIAERVTHELAQRIKASNVAASNAKYRTEIARTSGATSVLNQQLKETKQTAGATSWSRRVSDAERRDAEVRLRGAVEAQTESLLGAQLERQEQALDFEIVEETVRTTGVRLRPRLLGFGALMISLFFSFAFILLSNVGADLAVDDKDLRQAGLRHLGTIRMARGRS